MPFDTHLTPASCRCQMVSMARWEQLMTQLPIASDVTVALIDLSLLTRLQRVALKGVTRHSHGFLILQQEPLSARGPIGDAVLMGMLSAQRMEQVMIRFFMYPCINNSRVVLMNGAILTPENLEEAALLMRLSQNTLPATWLILQQI